MRTAIEQSPVSTVIFDPDGRCLLVNAAWNTLWDLERGETLEGTNIFENEQVNALGLAPYLKECMGDGKITTPLLFNEPLPIRAGGEPRWLRAIIYLVRDQDGHLLEVGLMLEDFTERKGLEEQLAYQAFHDPLTGLPNRALFLDRLEHAMSLSRQNAERNGGVTGEAARVALLFMDLDDFKRVNDSLGHAVGDELLVQVAGRVETSLRPGDTFAILLDEVEDAGAAAGLSERLVEILYAPFMVDGHEVFVTTSIGVVFSELGEGWGEELLRRADIAMYQGKRGGGDRCVIFSREMGSSDLGHLQLEGDFRRAIERGEFKVYYQPRVLIETEEIDGFEALVRWEHPEHGLLDPAEFISLAEESGLIIPLGRWILWEACHQVSLLRRQIPPEQPLNMCVNLSARQFRRPGLVEEITAILSETGLDPGDLTLEITESVVIQKEATAEVTLAALKNLGITIAMDDFGNGYSSLAYLRRFPVDVLKIDRSMMEGMNENAEDLAIVRAITSLAHDLGLTVVAEGVETIGQLEELRSLGCDFGQGHYWRRPCPIEEALKLLADGTRPWNR